MNSKKKIKEKQPRKGLLERRDRIMEAAAQVFAEKGIKGTTIDDIAEKAGVGKGTLYRRVGKKEDLARLLYQRAAELTNNQILAEIKKRDDPLLQFKEAVYAICDIYEKHLNLMILLITQAASHIANKEKEKEVRPNAQKDMFRLLEDIIQQAIKKGQIRPVDPHTIVKGLFFLLNPYYFQYLRYKLNYTKGEIAQLVIDLFLDGLKLKQ